MREDSTLCSTTSSAEYARKQLTGASLQRLQQNLNPENQHFVIIDEMSMCDQETLHWIDKRLRQASGKEDVLFGGFSVLLFGDFAQLPPVQGKPLFLKRDNPGYLTYLAFKKVVVLDQAQRQTGNAQKKFRAALLRLQDGCITEEDWKLWCSRDPEELGWNPEEWKRATRLYSTNILVDDYNSKKLEKLEAPTAPIFAENNYSKAKRADSNKAHAWSSSEGRLGEHLTFRQKLGW